MMPVHVRVDSLFPLPPVALTVALTVAMAVALSAQMFINSKTDLWRCFLITARHARISEATVSLFGGLIFVLFAVLSLTGRVPSCCIKWLAPTVVLFDGACWSEYGVMWMWAKSCGGRGVSKRLDDEAWEPSAMSSVHRALPFSISRRGRRQAAQSEDALVPAIAAQPMQSGSAVDGPRWSDYAMLVSTNIAQFV